MTDTCCSILSVTRCRCWALSLPQMWPRWQSRKACPLWLAFSARSLPPNLASKGSFADLIIGNNVLAQVPDLNDFVEGLRDSAQAPRDPDAGVPASAAIDRTQRI